ncbi:hypothetical protein HanRHA438_Chr09g0393671 [Helianthus annuus]|nr:hypothetical protein HanRHA438_Chr09g0393671 [Helianthus annuus]
MLAAVLCLSKMTKEEEDTKMMSAGCYCVSKRRRKGFWEIERDLKLGRLSAPVVGIAKIKKKGVYWMLMLYGIERVKGLMMSAQFVFGDWSDDLQLLLCFVSKRERERVWKMIVGW